MPWEYIEDGVTSDVTFRAWGQDLDELFSAAAEATASAMVEDAATTVAALRTVPVRAEASGLDLLLLRFLEELIFEKDARGLILRAREVRVDGDDAQGWTLQATLVGEPIDPARHALAGDVKAVTLYGLRVERDGAVWRAQVTLDV